MTTGLDVLPRFCVEAVDRRMDGDFVVTGRLSSWRDLGEAPAWFWLWASDEEAITPVVQRIDTASGRVWVLIKRGEMRPEIHPGSTLHWMCPSWQPYHVHMIRRGQWKRHTFAAQDAVTFELDEVKGWNRVAEEIPEGAVATGIRPGGWDHEHCEICGSRIGLGGFEEGYVDAEDHWLCPSCYERWAKPQDLGFLVERD